MRSIKDDLTVDGWLALCIAILCGVPQQEAFRKLYNPFSSRKWTEDDFLEIDYMKSNGASWREVGEALHTNKGNVLRQYRRWKEGQKEG